MDWQMRAIDLGALMGALVKRADHFFEKLFSLVENKFSIPGVLCTPYTSWLFKCATVPLSTK